MKFLLRLLFAIVLIQSCKKSEPKPSKWTKVSSFEPGGNLPVNAGARLFYYGHTFLFLAALDGIYFSKDDGKSFRKGVGLPDGEFAVDFAKTASGQVFAATTDGLYFLKSGGLNDVGDGPAVWEKVIGTPFNFLGNIEISGNEIIVQSALYVWTGNITNLGAWTQAVPVSEFLATSGSYVFASDNGLEVDTDHFYLSNDFGKNWRKMTTQGLPVGDVIFSANIWNGKVFIGTAKNGIYACTLNEGHWVKLPFDPAINSSGLDIVNSLSGAILNMYAVTTTSGVYISPQSGMSWQADNDGLSLPLATGLIEAGFSKVYLLAPDGLYTSPLSK